MGFLNKNSILIKFLVICILTGFVFNLFIPVAYAVAPPKDTKAKGAADQAKAKDQKALNDDKTVGFTGEWFYIGLGKILYIPLFLTSKLLVVGGALLNFVLKPFPITNNEFVKGAAKFTRDIANLFFILVILIIAFATILGIESYGIKAVLPYLIIAALLINFSLVIAGAIIDFGNVFANYFTELLTEGGKKDAGARLTGTLNLAATYKKEMETLSDEGRKSKQYAWFSLYTGMILAIFFQGVTFVILILLAGSFFVRNIALMILAILSPIAWILWLTPRTKPLWNEWWTNFLKWVFYPMIALFFVTLAIASTGAIPNALKQSLNELSNADGVKETIKESASLSLNFLVQFFLTFSFLVASLTVGKRLSLEAAENAVNFSKKMGKRGVNYTKQKLAPLTEKVGATMARTRIPGFRRVGLEMATIGAKTRSAEMKNAEDKLKSASDETLKTLLQSGAGSRAEKAYMAQRLAEKGKLDITNEKLKKDIIKTSRAMGTLGPILAARPDWIPDTIKKQKGETEESYQNRQQQAMKDYIASMPAQNASKIQKEAFDNDKFTQAFFSSARPQHIADITKNNPEILQHPKYQNYINNLKDPVIASKLETENPQLFHYLVATPNPMKTISTPPQTPPSSEKRLVKTPEEIRVEERKRKAEEKIQELRKSIKET